jgi:hypothetical protein
MEVIPECTGSSGTINQSHFPKESEIKTLNRKRLPPSLSQNSAIEGGSRVTGYSINEISSSAIGNRAS